MSNVCSYFKKYVRQMDRKILTLNPCLYCKIFLSRPKEHTHNRELESSGTPNRAEGGPMNAPYLVLAAITQIRQQ